MIKLVFCIFILGSFIYGQNDTIIFNQSTQNYDIYYTAESYQTGNDTVIFMECIPATKIIPIINAFVKKQYGSNSITYEYSIKNSEESVQNLKDFYIVCDKSLNIIDSTTNNWHRSGSRKGGWDWWGDQGLEPSWSVDGFKLSSESLPIIGTAQFRGYPSSVLSWPNNLWPKKDELIENIQELYKFENNLVFRKTIVPGNFPEEFSSIDFANTLIAYTNESYDLGWITDQAVANKYTNHFQNVKNYIQQNNIQGSINILNTVLQEVEQDSGLTLTSEAYALLKYNSEYLKEQITTE